MPAGRPTKFKEEYIEQAEKLSLLGLTSAQMADFFDVSESTFKLWMVEHEKFSASVKGGKEIADAEVVKALYKRACGMTIDDGEKMKEIPPDPTSMIFWLKNRQPKQWREKQEVQHSGEIKGQSVLVTRAEMSEEDKDDIGFIES